MADEKINNELTDNDKQLLALALTGILIRNPNDWILSNKVLIISQKLDLYESVIRDIGDWLDFSKKGSNA